MTTDMSVLILVAASTMIMLAASHTLLLSHPSISWKLKAIGLCVGTLFALAIILNANSLRGRAMPTTLEDLTSEPGFVVAYVISQEHGIRIWYQPDTARVPTYYVLPFTSELAEQLGDAFEEAAEGTGKVRGGREDNEEYQQGERLIYPEPQKALAPKTVPNNQPHILERNVQ